MKNVELCFYTEDELDFIYEMLSDSESVKYLEGMYTSTIEQAKIRLLMRLEDQNWGYRRRFLIRDADTREAVGEISGRNFKDASVMEIVIVIHPRFRGKGYAKAGTCEFIKHIMKEAPEITRFRMEINSSNIASISIAKELEFDLSEIIDKDTQCWEKDVR